MNPTLKTSRLLLVAATAGSARAELESGQRLAAVLGVTVPKEWPPPLNDQQSTRWLVDYLECDPDAAGWVLWYFLLPDAEGRLLAIGNGGFKGRPASDGTVEVGYSVLEAQQRNGYATEAVTALSEWAFEEPAVSRIIAHTLPDLMPSIRVLEKCGFRFVGPGEETGTIRYERTAARVT